MTKTTTKLGFSSSRNYWGWVVLSVFSVVIAIASMRYVIGVGPVAEVIPLNKFKDPWIILHAGFASLALLIGPFQFIQKIRSRFPMLHRWLGRVYVLSCTAGGIGRVHWPHLHFWVWTTWRILDWVYVNGMALCHQPPICRTPKMDDSFIRPHAIGCHFAFVSALCTVVSI